MVKILVIKFKNFKKSRCLSVSSPELIKRFQIRFISKIFSGWALFWGGGGGYSSKFHTGRIWPRANLLPFYIHVPFLTVKVPLLLPSIHNWYPFHIPSLELCIPFNCYKCTCLFTKEYTKPECFLYSSIAIKCIC